LTFGANIENIDMQSNTIIIDDASLFIFPIANNSSRDTFFSFRIYFLWKQIIEEKPIYSTKKSSQTFSFNRAI